MDKRIAIIGGSTTSIPLIRAAKAKNYECIVLDANLNAAGMKQADRAVVVDINCPERCLHSLAPFPPDGILTVTDFGVRSMAFINDSLGLTGPTPQAAANCTNKKRMRDIWHATGCDTTQYGIAHSPDEAKKIIASLGGFPVIFKPVRSTGGSRGVSVVKKNDQLWTAFNFAKKYDNKRQVLIEEYHQGLEHSAEVIVQNGKPIVLAISDKVKAPEPYRVDKSVDYPTSVHGAKYEKLIQTICKSVLALGLDWTAAHVEICSKPDGFYLFEAAARSGGGATASTIIPYVTGVNYPDVMLQLCLGEKIDMTLATPPKSCIYRFLTPPSGPLESIEGINTVRNMKNILECDFYLKPGDTIQKIRTGMDRSGHIVAAGLTRAEATLLADRAESLIRVNHTNS